MTITRQAAEPKGPKPQEAMKALPSDIARGPGFRPSHKQVLAEVEERLWIARHQLIGEKEKLAAGNWVNLGTDAKQEFTGSLVTEAQMYTPIAEVGMAEPA